MLVFLVVVLLGAGPATAKHDMLDARYTFPTGGYRVLVMEPDVSVALLTMGGMSEVNAEWTKAARTNLLAALETHQSARGGAVSIFDEAKLDPAGLERANDIIRLNGAVGQSIILHKVNRVSLPSKKDRFDWTLGAETAALGQSFSADYLLFLFARDSHSSGGRVAMNILAAALGAIPAGGQRVAFASLVDAKTGAVLWFDTLVSAGGDIRDPEGALATIDTLLKTLPLGTAPAKSGSRAGPKRR